MPWTEAREYCAEMERRAARRLLDMATAMRAARTDEKSWRKWVKSVESEI